MYVSQCITNVRMSPLSTTFYVSLGLGRQITHCTVSPLPQCIRSCILQLSAPILIWFLRKTFYGWSSESNRSFLRTRNMLGRLSGPQCPCKNVPALTTLSKYPASYGSCALRLTILRSTYLFFSLATSIISGLKSPP